jgi:Bifunctional DNA primase/polymerase, N-terminal
MTGLDSRSQLVHPFPGMTWIEIRTAAVEATTHGWPVLPGTYQLAEHATWLGKAQSLGLEPVDDRWTETATTDPSVAMDRWTARPYSLLLSCGSKVDAIEIPSMLGDPVVRLLRVNNSLGPIATTPFGTWLIFVQSGAPLHPNLASQVGITLHSNSSWVPLPPTNHGQIPYQWQIPPASVEWSLPSSRAVQAALNDATSRPRIERGTILRSLVP